MAGRDTKTKGKPGRRQREDGGKKPSKTERKKVHRATKTETNTSNKPRKSTLISSSSQSPLCKPEKEEPKQQAVTFIVTETRGKQKGESHARQGERLKPKENRGGQSQRFRVRSPGRTDKQRTIRKKENKKGNRWLLSSQRAFAITIVFVPFVSCTEVSATPFAF